MMDRRECRRIALDIVAALKSALVNASIPTPGYIAGPITIDVDAEVFRAVAFGLEAGEATWKLDSFDGRRPALELAHVNATIRVAEDPLERVAREAAADAKSRLDELARREHRCRTCHGGGIVDGDNRAVPATCPTCRGSGRR